MTGAEPVIEAVLAGIAGGSLGQAGARLWDTLASLVGRNLGDQFLTRHVPSEPTALSPAQVETLSEVLTEQMTEHPEFGSAFRSWLQEASTILNVGVSNTIVGDVSGNVVQARDVGNVHLG